MKSFISWSELVSVLFKKNSQAVTLRPNQTTTYTASRDIQLPQQDSDAVLVSRNSPDTLTNKTLTSPAITTPSGIVKGDVGLGNVDNTSDATKNAASVTLTNKTISGTSNTLTVRLANDVTGTLPIASGGTGQTSKTDAFDALAPTTTKGDLIVSNGSDNIRFAAGSNGTVLSADSAQASGLNWVSPLTNPMSATGDIIIGGASGAATRLAIGTTGQTLTVVSGSPAWQTGLTGQISGSAVAAGIVGERKESSSSVTNGSWGGTAVYQSTTSLSLEAGVWCISAMYAFDSVSATTPLFYCGISTTDGNSATGLNIGQNLFYVSPPSGGAGMVCVPNFIVLLSSTTTYYMKQRVNYGGSAPDRLGYRFTAVRIA